MTVQVEVRLVSRGGAVTVSDGTTTRRLGPNQHTRMDVGTISGGAVTLTVTEVAKPVAGNYGPLDKPDT